MQKTRFIIFVLNEHALCRIISHYIISSYDVRFFFFFVLFFFFILFYFIHLFIYLFIYLFYFIYLFIFFFLRKYCDGNIDYSCRLE